MYSGDPAKTSGHLVLTSNFGIKCFHTSSNDGLANKQRSFKMKYSIALRNAIDCFLNVHSLTLPSQQQNSLVNSKSHLTHVCQK